MTTELETAWQKLEICEAHLEKWRLAGGEAEPAFAEAAAVIATQRAQIKEIQRTQRAKFPEDPWPRPHSQRPQEDAQWLIDGGWSGKR